MSSFLRRFQDKLEHILESSYLTAQHVVLNNPFENPYHLTIVLVDMFHEDVCILLPCLVFS